MRPASRIRRAALSPPACLPHGLRSWTVFPGRTRPSASTLPAFSSTTVTGPCPLLQIQPPCFPWRSPSHTRRGPCLGPPSPLGGDRAANFTAARRAFGRTDSWGCSTTSTLTSLAGVPGEAASFRGRSPVSRLSWRTSCLLGAACPSPRSWVAAAARLHWQPCCGSLFRMDIQVLWMLMPCARWRCQFELTGWRCRLPPALLTLWTFWTASALPCSPTGVGERSPAQSFDRRCDHATAFLQARRGPCTRSWLPPVWAP